MTKDKIVWNLKDIKEAKFFTYDLENLSSISRTFLAKETNYCKCADCRRKYSIDVFWQNDKKLSSYLVSRALDKVDKNNKVTKHLKW